MITLQYEESLIGQPLVNSAYVFRKDFHYGYGYTKYQFRRDLTGLNIEFFLLVWFSQEGSRAQSA